MGANAQEQSEAPRARQGSSERPRGARILLAEDHAAVRCLVSTSLRNRGHRVVEARNGAEALARLRSETFDLLLTDVDMPELSGLVLLEHVTAIEPGLRVVVMSAAHAHSATALELGAVAFLEKPFTLQLLARTVEACRGWPGTPRPRARVQRTVESLGTVNSNFEIR